MFVNFFPGSASMVGYHFGIPNQTVAFYDTPPPEVSKGLFKIRPEMCGRVNIVGNHPQFWYHWGQYIVIEPIPNNVYKLILYVSDAPPSELEKETDYPDGIPDAFHPLIVDYACYLLSMKLKRWDKAVKFYNRFVTNLTIRKKEYMEQKADTKLLYVIPDTVNYTRMA